jgi:hypothetical protein
MTAPAITICTHCSMRILPVDGSCPACGKALDAPRQPPPRPQKKPSIHPVLYGCCLLMIVGSLVQWYLVRPNATMGTVAWILAVMWLGTLGVLVLTFRREVLLRRWKRQQARQSRA